ncbi:GNAT family N-acetyltransferase [Inhella sp.]|uniref:GNAT family N-acetyltransferase n=1 Tax=Inhella sp. TaxID=1921806 RepID=UPI0035B17621
MSGALLLRGLQAADRADWERLARGYKAFYGVQLNDAAYEATWRRLLQGGPAQALVLSDGKRLLGLTHYLFQSSTWGEWVCYLQDLFVDPERRSQGLGRRLIEAVAEQARSQGAQRLYWLTQAHNSTARALYDRLAEHRGFIRYDYPL